MVQDEITQSVKIALHEDLNGLSATEGDITAHLIPEGKQAKAMVITREDAVFCGKEWSEEVFRQLGDDVTITCSVRKGNPSNYLYVITNVNTTSTTIGPTRILTGIEAADFGIYRCDVTNNAGTGSAAIKIQSEFFLY